MGANRALTEHVDWIDSGFMREAEALLQQVAASNMPVLILGETGVGKGVLARRLHALSSRANKPFVKVNCVALPSELLESELFGYERGAFTGAFQEKAGRFEMAQDGTILLDEIGDMDVRLQGKLLHVLEDQEFYRLGGERPVHVNVRLLAATYCELAEEIRQRRFRADLYYRLGVVKIRVPPLRQRREEILPLADLFTRTHATPGGPPLEIPPVLREAFLAYDWPGNIRELENIVREFLVRRSVDDVLTELASGATLWTSSRVEPRDQAVLEAASALSPLREMREAQKKAESRAIIEALEATRWNRTKAARLLEVDYTALLYRM